MGNIVTNAIGAFGDTSLESTVWHLDATMQASAAITAKRVVAMGTDGTVATAATNGTASLVVGIGRTTAAAAAAAVEVTVMGIAEDVPAAGAVAAGDLLKRSATTAGYVSATATPAAGEVVGVAINASASNVVDVWVCKSPVLS